MGDDLTFDRIKYVTLELLATSQQQHNPNHIENFQKWICSGEYLKDLENYNAEKEVDKKLASIVVDLRALLPSNHVFPSENIIEPETDDDEKQITQHIDEFLYEDSELEELITERKIEKHFCGDCGSHNIREVDLISHSLSKQKSQYIFKCLLPSDCKNLQILDVGSRIGAVLYGAYFYSNCDNIFGVEISKDLCNTQNKIIQSHSLDKRIKVINSDIMEQESILKTSDIVILNNVFEYFISTEKQIEIWKFLKANLKKGCLVVTIPSIEEVLMKLDIYEELTGSAWFTKKTDCQPENNGMFSEDDLASFSDIYFYRIT